jgi:hypothetical protein
MIDQMLTGLVPDFPDNADPADPNADNSHALVPSNSGFLSHDETPKPPP